MYEDRVIFFIPLRFFFSQIADNRDGTYGIGFTPDAEGALVLIINIHDKPIKVIFFY